jgi:hypothetical protein
VPVVYAYELGAKPQKNSIVLKKCLKTWQMPLVAEPVYSEVFINLPFMLHEAIKE